jgi:hypothetical protein
LVFVTLFSWVYFLFPCCWALSTTACHCAYNSVSKGLVWGPHCYHSTFPCYPTFYSTRNRRHFFQCHFNDCFVQDPAGSCLDGAVNALTGWNLQNRCNVSLNVSLDVWNSNSSIKSCTDGIGDVCIQRLRCWRSRWVPQWL